MKWLLLICLAGVASANPRHSPGKYAAAAGAEFDKALDADHHGQLELALEHYRNAFEISPHPDVMFNEASVEERLDHDHEALAAYELYLLLAPDAPDRAQVEATIKRIATKLHPIKVELVHLELADAYVVLDGEIIAKPGQVKEPLTINVMNGQHFIAAITALSFAGEEFSVQSQISDHAGKVVLSAKPRDDGNVAITMPYLYGATFDNSASYHEAERFTGPVGTQFLRVRDDKYECPAVKIAVPRDGVAFVAIMDAEVPEVAVSEGIVGRCRKLTVKQQHLVFAK